MSLSLMIGLSAITGMAYAQAPGQDTIVITTAPNSGGANGNPERPGKGMEQRSDMPIGLKAKIARYTALDMSRGEDNTKSENIVKQADSAGFTKTCTQDIASNTAPSGMGSGRYGPRPQDQVVVLRGDFINVCR
jgi:hypothetical protein